MTKRPQTRLLVASTNPGKMQEYRALLASLPARLVFPADLGLRLTVPEDAPTYRDNARAKAVAYSEASGLLTLADDSGLEVDALGGEPGVRSSRYAGEGADDARRRAYVREKLSLTASPRPARFRCWVALSQPGGSIQYAEGICEGEILLEERGVNGFGYDPLFQVRGLGLTLAELAPEEKNRVSHRAHAVQVIWPHMLAALAALGAAEL
ncbi:MAG TPA: non-canonical purine NTP pyrophosphatase [Anaerolineales bacterium]|nr:non-canonical purine NTP pyrophosphatase [Anaerolineales bacterium]